MMFALSGPGVDGVGKCQCAVIFLWYVYDDAALLILSSTLQGFIRER